MCWWRKKGPTGPSNITVTPVSLGNFEITGEVLNTIYNLGTVTLQPGTYQCFFNCFLFFQSLQDVVALFSYIGTSNSPNNQGTTLGSVMWPGNSLSGLNGIFVGTGILNTQTITIVNIDTPVYFSITIIQKGQAGTIYLNQNFDGGLTSSSYANCIKLL